MTISVREAILLCLHCTVLGPRLFIIIKISHLNLSLKSPLCQVTSCFRIQGPVWYLPCSAKKRGVPHFQYSTTNTTFAVQTSGPFFFFPRTCTVNLAALCNTGGNDNGMAEPGGLLRKQIWTDLGWELQKLCVSEHGWNCSEAAPCPCSCQRCSHYHAFVAGSRWQAPKSTFWSGSTRCDSLLWG